jgi:hypothetical protein
MRSMDVSHGCYSGSEAQFDNLRLMWAMAAGYGVNDYRILGGPVLPNLKYEDFEEADLDGDWPAGAPDDPLVILLVHRERSGRIKWQHCPLLADRLEELEMVMSAPGTTPAWVLLTQQFYRGLRTAAHWRQDVVFQ